LCRGLWGIELFGKSIDNTSSLSRLSVFKEVGNRCPPFSRSTGHSRKHALAGIAQSIGDCEVALTLDLSSLKRSCNFIWCLPTLDNGPRDLTTRQAFRIDLGNDV
jgi:hypothetical protein